MRVFSAVVKCQALRIQSSRAPDWRWISPIDSGEPRLERFDIVVFLLIVDDFVANSVIFGACKEIIARHLSYIAQFIQSRHHADVESVTRRLDRPKPKSSSIPPRRYDIGQVTMARPSPSRPHFRDRTPSVTSGRADDFAARQTCNRYFRYAQVAVKAPAAVEQKLAPSASYL